MHAKSNNLAPKKFQKKNAKAEYNRQFLNINAKTLKHPCAPNTGFQAKEQQFDLVNKNSRERGGKGWLVVWIHWSTGCPWRVGGGDIYSIKAIYCIPVPARNWTHIFTFWSTCLNDWSLWVSKLCWAQSSTNIAASLQDWTKLFRLPRWYSLLQEDMPCQNQLSLNVFWFVRHIPKSERAQGWPNNG